MRFLLVILLAVFAMPVAASGSCSGHHCDDDHEHHHHAGTVSKKKTVDLRAVAFTAIAVGATTYCAVRRWGYNEPCIGEPLKKTSFADDQITPNNLSDQKINVRVYE